MLGKTHAAGIFRQHAEIVDQHLRQQDPATNGKPFDETLDGALDDVARLDKQAGDLTKAYEVGSTDDISTVMVAKAKASVAFEATLQVRNKVLAVYKDIMSMPV